MVTVSDRSGDIPVDSLEKNLIERVCVGDAVTRVADRYPDRPAIVHGDRATTYADLETRTNQLAHALLGLGLARQEVVGVMARNCTELLVTYFACAKAGLICSPVNLGLKGPEIAYCLNDAGARVLIVEDALADAARALPEALPHLEWVYWTGEDAHAEVPKSAGTFDGLVEQGSPESVEVEVHDRDPVQLLYTSGTTAHPKGVLTSHLAVTMAALSAAIANRMTAEHSRMILTLPLFHCAMLNSAAVPLVTIAGTAILMQEFEPERTAALIDEHCADAIVLLPMMYGAMLAEPKVRDYDLSSLTRAVYGMAPMPEERMNAIRELFPNADVLLGSGQTEFTPPATFQRPQNQWDKFASWGPATNMTRTAIMDDSGNLLPRGEVGELVYRGPMVMNGYLNLPEKTAESFAQGWFHSGDVAWMDDEGVIWFTDRKKDMIKSGGENVASIEVERCLMEHPAVAEAAVVGLPHDHWGEAVTAGVVLKGGASATEDELIDHCRQRIADFKAPKAVKLLDEFPRTGTGKIQKHLMREELRDLFMG